MSDVGPSRAAARRRQTRDRLIQAVIELMATTSPDHLTIQAITDQADLGFGTFYVHFDTKVELFVAALEVLSTRVNRRIGAVVAHLDDPADGFATVIRMILTAARDDTPQTVLWRRYQMELEAGGAMATSGAKAALLAGTAAGRFSVGDVELAAVAVAAVVTAAVGLTVGKTTKEARVTASNTASMVLPMLGIPHDEASELSRRRLRSHEQI